MSRPAGRAPTRAHAAVAACRGSCSLLHSVAAQAWRTSACRQCQCQMLRPAKWAPPEHMQLWQPARARVHCCTVWLHRPGAHQPAGSASARNGRTRSGVFRSPGTGLPSSAAARGAGEAGTAPFGGGVPLGGGDTLGGEVPLGAGDRGPAELGAGEASSGAEAGLGGDAARPSSVAVGVATAAARQSRQSAAAA